MIKIPAAHSSWLWILKRCMRIVPFWHIHTYTLCRFITHMDYMKLRSNVRVCNRSLAYCFRIEQTKRMRQRIFGDIAQYRASAYVCMPIIPDAQTQCRDAIHVATACRAHPHGIWICVGWCCFCICLVNESNFIIISIWIIYYIRNTHGHSSFEWAHTNLTDCIMDDRVRADVELGTMLSPLPDEKRAKLVGNLKWMRLWYD